MKATTPSAAGRTGLVIGQKGYRENLAKAVKAFRSGKAAKYKGSYVGFPQSDIMRRAVESTSYRNARRLGASASAAHERDNYNRDLKLRIQNKRVGRK